MPKGKPFCPVGRTNDRVRVDGPSVYISSVYIIKALSHNEDLTEINSNLITVNILNIYICTLSSF